MKTAIRNIIVAIYFSPLIVFVHLSSLFIGRRKSISVAGPILTRAAKQSLRYWVPGIDRPEDFDKFAPTMKARIRFWKLLYDVEITAETADLFQVRIANCPFYEVLAAVGLRELGPYLCEGDWEKARENSNKWSFARKHQIATGDLFCDHTYMRKKDR